MHKSFKLITLPLLTLALSSCSHYDSSYRIFVTKPNESIYVDGVTFRGYAEINETREHVPVIDFHLLASRNQYATFGSTFVTKIKCISPDGIITRQYPRGYSSVTSSQLFTFDFAKQDYDSIDGYTFSMYIGDAVILSVNY